MLSPMATPKKRRLQGRALLAAVGFTAVTQMECSSTSVANLVAPPEDTGVDAGPMTDVGTDRGPILVDVPVANLLPPPDVFMLDRGPDLSDTPVANLVAPPDVVMPQDTPDVTDAQDAPDVQDVGTDRGPDFRDIPVANLVPPPDSGR